MPGWTTFAWLANQPFEVHYDGPTASPRRPGVAYPVSPQERFDELKCIIHQASVLNTAA